MNNPQLILGIVEDYYNIPTGCIETWCRTNTVAQARAMAQYVIKQKCTYSYEELSRMFKRDVSGIKKNCKKVVKKLESGHEFTTMIYNKIIEDLKREYYD